jgi:hypothetical protein
MKNIKFTCTIREQKSKLGSYGKIVNKGLSEMIGKKVEIRVKEVGDV